MMNGGLPNMPGGYFPLSAPANGMMVCMSFYHLLVLVVRRIIHVLAIQASGSWELIG